VEAVVACESGWRTWVVSPGGHLGLAQFAPGTWATAARRSGLWDWQDAYSQGVNVAVLMSIAAPAGQWSCW
jgi:soluble lytic murein transglycosylase-like protein